MNSSSSASLRSPGQQQLHMLSQNLGRISSYMAIGLLFGLAGEYISLLIDIPQWSRMLRIATALIVMMIGLQLLTGKRQGLYWLEPVTGRLWQKLQPRMQGFVHSPALTSSWKLGVLWGLLPCGLVYSIALTAATSGSAFNGTLTMLGFGLGTLPSLLLSGQLFWYFKRTMQKRLVQATGGITLLLLGSLTLAAPALVSHDSLKLHPLFMEMVQCL